MVSRPTGRQAIHLLLTGRRRAGNSGRERAANGNGAARSAHRPSQHPANAQRARGEHPANTQQTPSEHGASTGRARDGRATGADEHWRECSQSPTRALHAILDDMSAPLSSVCPRGIGIACRCAGQMHVEYEQYTICVRPETGVTFTRDRARRREWGIARPSLFCAPGQHTVSGLARARGVALPVSPAAVVQL